jgi:hypothetical protein
MIVKATEMKNRLIAELAFLSKTTYQGVESGQYFE